MGSTGIWTPGTVRLGNPVSGCSASGAVGTSPLPLPLPLPLFPFPLLPLPCPPSGVGPVIKREFSAWSAAGESSSSFAAGVPVVVGVDVTVTSVEGPGSADAAGEVRARRMPETTNPSDATSTENHTVVGRITRCFGIESSSPEITRGGLLNFRHLHGLFRWA
jgi:hypothetical protein